MCHFYEFYFYLDLVWYTFFKGSETFLDFDPSFFIFFVTFTILLVPWDYLGGWTD